MQKLIEGILIFHKLNFVHNDLRPENIYVNLDKNSKELTIKISLSLLFCKSLE